MKFTHPAIAGTIHLFFPHHCLGCGSDLLETKNLLCLKCIHDLPHTHFASYADNPVEKIFRGRIKITSAHSEFYFTKDSLIQHLVHLLKYKSNPGIGIYLGECLGNSLLHAGRFNSIDALIPLPLFPEKERKRGYNQAALICKGIHHIIPVPVIKNNLIRQRPTETQTKKHRTERWDNVKDSFVINDPSVLEGKHILLVDDVITTGATLEAAGSALLKLRDLTLSFATLAVAAR